MLPGSRPIPVDMAFAWIDGVRRTGLVLSEVGDLEEAYGLEVIDATGLYLHPESPLLGFDSSGAWLILDTPAVLTLRKGPDRTSEPVMTIGGNG